MIQCLSVLSESLNHKKRFRPYDSDRLPKQLVSLIHCILFKYESNRPYELPVQIIRIIKFIPIQTVLLEKSQITPNDSVRELAFKPFSFDRLFYQSSKREIYLRIGHPFRF